MPLPRAQQYAAAVLADAPLGLWLMDETSGTVLTDSSGNGRHGTYTNPSFGTTSPLGREFVAPNDGTTRWAQVPNLDLSAVYGVTLEFWFRPDAWAGTSQLVIEHSPNSAANDSFALLNTGGTTLRQRVYATSGPVDRRKDYALPSTGAWQFWSMTFSRGSGTTVGGISLRIDDVLVSATATNDGTITTPFGNFHLNILARQGGSLRAFGRIAGLAVFPSVLTAARRTAHYNAGNADGADVAVAFSGSGDLAVAAQAEAVPPQSIAVAFTGSGDLSVGPRLPVGSGIEFVATIGDGTRAAPSGVPIVVPLDTMPGLAVGDTVAIAFVHRRQVNDHFSPASLTPSTAAPALVSDATNENSRAFLFSSITVTADHLAAGAVSYTPNDDLFVSWSAVAWRGHVPIMVGAASMGTGNGNTPTIYPSGGSSRPGAVALTFVGDVEGDYPATWADGPAGLTRLFYSAPVGNEANLGVYARAVPAGSSSVGSGVGSTSGFTYRRMLLLVPIEVASVAVAFSGSGDLAVAAVGDPPVFSATTDTVGYPTGGAVTSTSTAYGGKQTTEVVLGGEVELDAIWWNVWRPAADTSGGIQSQFTLRVDGDLVATVATDGAASGAQWLRFPVGLTLAAGPHTVELARIAGGSGWAYRAQHAYNEAWFAYRHWQEAGGGEIPLVRAEGRLIRSAIVAALPGPVTREASNRTAVTWSQTFHADTAVSAVLIQGTPGSSSTWVVERDGVVVGSSPPLSGSWTAANPADSFPVVFDPPLHFAAGQAYTMKYRRSDNGGHPGQQYVAGAGYADTRQTVGEWQEVPGRTPAVIWYAEQATRARWFAPAGSGDLVVDLTTEAGPSTAEVAVAFVGAGSIVVVGDTVDGADVAVAFAGAGSLGVDVQAVAPPTPEADVAFAVTGTGTLAVDASAVDVLAFSFVGAGTFGVAAEGIDPQTVEVAFVGSGTFGVAAVDVPPGGSTGEFVSFTGAGHLGVDLRSDEGAVVSFTGTGYLDVSIPPKGRRRRIVPVLLDGTPYAGELVDAVLGDLTWNLNGPDSWSAVLPSSSEQAHLVLDERLREVQVWIGDYLATWGPITRPAQDSGGTLAIAGSGADWHLTRRHIGRADRTNYLRNGGFEEGLSGWGRFTNPVPIFYGQPNAAPVPDAETVREPTITGRRAVRVTQSVVGSDTALFQNIEWNAPARAQNPDGDEWTMRAYVWIEEDAIPWATLGVDAVPAMMIARYSTTEPETDPTVLAAAPYAMRLLELQTYEITPDTPTNTWHRMELALVVPPSSATETVNVRLYAIGGASVVYDEAALTLNETERFRNYDQALIVRDLVAHLQDGDYGKSNVNIGTDTPRTHVRRNRNYVHAEHENGWSAIEEFTSLRDGLDLSMGYGPTTRTLRTHYPHRGRWKPGRPLVYGLNVTEYAWGFDGEAAATSVVTLGEGDGSDREEGWAADASGFAEGVTVEVVFAPGPDTPIDALDDRAAEELEVAREPEVLTLTTFPSTDLLGRIGVGDWCPVTVVDGALRLRSVPYRIVRMGLNADDSLTLTLNRRDVPGMPFTPPEEP